MTKYYTESLLRLHLHIKDQNMDQRKNLKLPYLYLIIESFAKFGWQTFEFIRKRMYSLVNVENYQNTEFTENNIKF